MAQERNTGMSVGMQSKITDGRETCGNISSPVVCCRWCE